MKFFKVTLNTVGKDNEKVLFIVPPTEEKDENGNPVYDEDFLLNNAEYKNYIKATKAAVVSVAYILYEAEDSTKLNYDELLKSENSFFKVEQNEYLIEVKKAKPKSGGKKSSTALYFILGIVGAAVVAMMIYGGSLKKKSDGAVESGSGTTEITADTYSTTEISEETTSEITVIAEAISETETTAAQTEPDVSTAEEMHTLSFDLNGGVGAQKDVAYPSGTVVELPFTGTSRIGYTLMGWASAPTEPYTLYDNGNNRYVMSSAPATLYAIWTAAEYEVTYNYQIGANAVSSKERGKYGELIQLMDVSSVASDAGEFVGWGLLPNSDEPVQSLTMPDGGIELYAIYKKVE